MEVREAIKSRRSIGRVRTTPVSKEIVEEILESAVHAPNHKITEPWRFHVFMGKGRGEFARARAELARILAESENEEEEYIAGRVSRERKKAFRAPVVIAVISEGADRPRPGPRYNLAYRPCGIPSVYARLLRSAGER